MRYQVSFAYKGTLLRVQFKTYKGVSVCLRRLAMRGVKATVVRYSL